MVLFPKPIVIIESPYAGNVEQNVAYARAAMHDCLLRGEAPYASHLLYTQPGVLDDKIPEERKLGIEAGFRFRLAAQKSVVYSDLGMSSGMKWGIEDSQKRGIPVEYRSLPEWARNPTLKELESKDEAWRLARVLPIPRKEIGTAWSIGHYDGPASGVVYYKDELYGVDAIDVMDRITDDRWYYVVKLPSDVLELEKKLHKLTNDMCGYYCDYTANGVNLKNTWDHPENWSALFEEYKKVYGDLHLPSMRWANCEVVGRFPNWRYHPDDD